MTWFQNLSHAEQQRAQHLLDSPIGEDARRYAGTEDTDFAAWLAVADHRCRQRYALSIFDLPDFLWRDHHDDGLTPDEALAAAIEYARES